MERKSTIKKFWHWFEKHQLELEPEKIDDKFIDRLDQEILLLGNFTWEIREGNKKPNMLIISPGGDIDLLKDTKSIIELAPSNDKWEFYFYKPSKKWDYKFSFIEHSGVKRMVTAEDWEYVLLKFKDGTYDIIIKANNLNTIPEEERLIAIDIVLESILGEKLSLELIKNIELTNSFIDDYSSKKSSIKNLKDHIFKLESNVIPR